MSIENDFVELIGEQAVVNVPSIEDILGDKMTAFAPETTGIPYFKNGKLATLEIIKQLYDIGRLFDKIEDMTVTLEAFKKIAKVEMGYRGMLGNFSEIYDDIRQTALNISTRGFLDKDKFSLLQQGIKNIRPFMYKSQYIIENAIADAAKAAYLATLAEFGITKVDHYNGEPMAIKDMTIGTTLTNKLNKLRIGNPESYFYWSKTGELLDKKL